MDMIRNAALEHVSQVFVSPADRSGAKVRFVALDDVSISFFRGELHSILGENGAGKSTLVHIFSGLHTPTAGRILLNDRTVSFQSPADALSHGIAMVHQRPLLADDMTVLENIALGRCGLLVRRRKLRSQMEDIATRWNCLVDFNAIVRTLDPADRLKTALLCALYTNPSFLILDEPTAILPPEERDRFLKTLAQNAQGGMGIIVITHKMGEAARWAHRISVLKHGHLVKTIDQQNNPVTEDDLSALFTPELKNETKTEQAKRVRISSVQPTVKNHEFSEERQNAVSFTVSQVSAFPKNRQEIQNISFSARQGAITGILAYPGSGLETLEDVLSGMLPATTGSITIPCDENTSIQIKAANCSPALLRKHRVAIVPSNRAIRGTHPDISIHDALIPYFSGKIFTEQTDRFSKTIVKTEQIADQPFRPVRTLSGGQLQKLILTRELSIKPRVLILADPEWGLDMASVLRLRQQLWETAKTGVAILILTDTPDTMEIRDFFSKTYTLREGSLE